MELIEFNGKKYPAFQASGNAARFALPFAKEVCKGRGYDIGCSEWCLSYEIQGTRCIDTAIDDEYDAMNLPEKGMDFIFSSHCLEHLTNWVDALNYWTDHLREGGILFLYLPDFSQEYWRPWNNRKHVSVFTPEIIEEYLKTRYINIFKSGVDLNNSFTVVGQKA